MARSSGQSATPSRAMRSIERLMSSRPSKCHRAASLGDDPHDRLQRGRLARAVPPKQSDEFAFAHVKIDAMENMRFVVPGLQAFDLEHGRRVRRRACLRSRLSHVRLPYRPAGPPRFRDRSIVAFRQHPPARQHGDAVRQVGDDLKIVLDHQDRAVGGNPANEVGDPVDVLVAHARHRFIEQHHLRLDRQSRGQFQRPLAAIGDFAGLGIGEGRQPDIVQEFERPSVERIERRLRAPEVERIAALALQGDAHIFERGQVGKNRRNLERAHEAETRHIGRPHRGDVAAVERDSPGARRDEFGQHIEAGRLAGAVRPNQGVNRPALDAQGDVADCAEIAEALAKALGDENVIRAHSRRSSERMRFPR